MKNNGALKNVTPLATIWLIGVVLLTLPLLGSLMNSVHPFFDSLADIRIPLAILTILLTLPLFLTPLKKQALMMIIFALMIVSFSKQTGGIKAQGANAEKTIFKLVQINLRYNNPTPQKLIALIEKEQPDILTFQEASKQWQPVLKAISKLMGNNMHQCKKENDRIGANGIIFSRKRTTQAIYDVPNCIYAQTTRGILIGYSLPLEDNPMQTIDVFSAHLSWPWPYGQNRQLNELEQWFMQRYDHNQTRNHAMIVAGDFNAVTWSNTVRKLEKTTHTRHIAGLGNTFLSYQFPSFMRPVFGLPIDQVLVSDTIHVIRAGTLPSIGSDHLPVVIEFQLNDN